MPQNRSTKDGLMRCGLVWTWPAHCWSEAAPFDDEAYAEHWFEKEP